MSQRHQLETRRAALQEVGSIMGSLKTLALVETHKLSRFIHCQKEVVSAIERAAARLLAHHGSARRRPAGTDCVTLVLGSERGFCGDYNRCLPALLGNDGEGPLLAVGRRLWSHLEGRPRLHLLAGANSAEEIGAVLREVVRRLAELTPGTTGLQVIFHDLDGPVLRQVMPAFTQLALDAAAYPPLAYLPPATLLNQLSERYLGAALYDIFCSALLCENQRRLQHLEGAMRHLEERTRRLSLRCHSLRQEEITEELQVIMLNYESGCL